MNSVNGNGANADHVDAAIKGNLNSSIVRDADPGVKRKEANKRRRVRRAERKKGLLLFSAKLDGERCYYLAHESMAIDIDERACFCDVEDDDQIDLRYRQELLLEKMMFGNDTEAVSALIVFRREASAGRIEVGRLNGNGGAR